MRIVAVVMAGGRAERMGGVVKPLLRVCGKPLIEHVLGPLEGAWRIILALSRYTVEGLRGYCRRYNCIYTSGAGYPWDLGEVLASILYRPLIIVPADIVGLGPWLLKLAEDVGDRSIYTVKCGGRPLGVSIIPGRGWDWEDLEAECRVVNVNTWEDLERAEQACRGYMEGTRLRAS